MLPIHLSLAFKNDLSVSCMFIPHMTPLSIYVTQVTTLAGDVGEGGVAVDSGGNIFGPSYNRITRIDWSSFTVSIVAGNGAIRELDGVGTSAGFNQPYGLTIFNESIWVIDHTGGTVRHISMVWCCLVIYLLY